MNRGAVTAGPPQTTTPGLRQPNRPARPGHPDGHPSSTPRPPPKPGSRPTRAPPAPGAAVPDGIGLPGWRIARNAIGPGSGPVRHRRQRTEPPLPGPGREPGPVRGVHLLRVHRGRGVHRGPDVGEGLPSQDRPGRIRPGQVQRGRREFRQPGQACARQVLAATATGGEPAGAAPMAASGAASRTAPLTVVPPADPVCSGSSARRTDRAPEALSRVTDVGTRAVLRCQASRHGSNVGGPIGFGIGTRSRGSRSRSSEVVYPVPTRLVNGPTRRPPDRPIARSRPALDPTATRYRSSRQTYRPCPHPSKHHTTGVSCHEAHTPPG